MALLDASGPTAPPSVIVTTPPSVIVPTVIGVRVVWI